MIANARMYSATPQAKQAWKALLRNVLERAGLDWEILDYDAPAPLAALWAREDLGCVMMCGLPYWQRTARPTLIAAPIPSPERYGGRPVYFTDFAVAADSPFRALEDTFGSVVGYTLRDSFSGCVAARAHLLRYRETLGAPLFREAKGGYVNARAVVEALHQGQIDVGPLDSYYFDLLRSGDPACAAKVRVVASSAPAPMPPFVATAALPSAALKALRDAVLEAGRSSELAEQRRVLLLAGFAVPRNNDYEVVDAAFARSRAFPELW